MDSKELISTSQVAEILGVTPMRVIQLANEGVLPTQGRFGRQAMRLFLRKDVERLAQIRSKQMNKFNNGKPYHGSDEIMRGKLTGATDTDWFYFFCPRCPDKQILQLLDRHVIIDGPVEHMKEQRPKAKRDFRIVFQLYCPSCNLEDFVKVSNLGWQGGKLPEPRSRISGNAIG